MGWMKDIGRLGVTSFIWGIAGVIAITSMTTYRGITSGSVIIVLVCLTFAYTTTRVLWEKQTQESAEKAPRAEPLGKPKRGTPDSKTEMLLALMDDDEREAFKQALKYKILSEGARLTDEGELDMSTSLEALLEEERRRYPK